MTSIYETIPSLQDGLMVELPSGEKIFRLHSHPSNPIITPEDFAQVWYDNDILKYGAIFNGGATLFNEMVILTPRIHAEYQRGQFFDETLGRDKFVFRNYISKIWILSSKDGLNFERYDDRLIKGDGEDHRDFIYGIEDVRIVKNNNLYWLIGCGKVMPPFMGNKDEPGDRTAFYSTTDFKDIKYHGVIPDIESRNTVLFPELISGKQYIFLRLFGDIYLNYYEPNPNPLQNPSSFPELWKRMYQDRTNRLLFAKGTYPHEREKIGPGPPPVRTNRGWLMIYHSVGEVNSDLCQVYGLSDEIKRAYSVCAAILDIKDPSKVLCRTKLPLYIPSHPWELHGNSEYPIDVPAVVFPVGMIVYKNKVLLYCGAGDKYIILLSSKLDSLVNYLWDECRLE